MAQLKAALMGLRFAEVPDCGEAGQGRFLRPQIKQQCSKSRKTDWLQVFA